MRKNVSHLAFGIMALLFGVSCTGTNVGVILGNANTNPAQEYANPIYTMNKGGLFFHKDTVAGQLGNANSQKSGESCSHSVLWLAGWGDSSIETAKKNAGITKIATIQFKELGIIGAVYHGFCTQITGE